MGKLELFFHSRNEPQLEKTFFIHPVLSSQPATCRGKIPGAFSGYGSFMWSPAVRALSCLLLKCAAWANVSKENKIGQPPRMAGEKDSLASSLDYALSKQPNWLIDMFGSNSSGRAYARHLISRSNPERKRPGPVTLSLNTNFLRAEDIHVFIGQRKIIEEQELMAIADKIARSSQESRQLHLDRDDSSKAVSA